MLAAATVISESVTSTDIVRRGGKSDIKFRDKFTHPARATSLRDQSPGETLTSLQGFQLEVARLGLASEVSASLP